MGSQLRKRPMVSELDILQKKTSATLFPLAFEVGGRPSQETIAFFKGWAIVEVGQWETADCHSMQMAWQQCSILLQLGTAEMLLSALG